MMPRLLRLVEYRPREVRLRPDDVAALMPWSAWLEIRPTMQCGIYRLTALGCVGVVQTARLRIVVRPKIPTANVYHLLGEETATFADATTPEPGTEAIAFLVRRLATLLCERGTHGLPRTYIEVADQQAFLQGRLDVVAQARELPTAKDRFHVQREEFTVDSPLHRLAKFTAITLLGSPLVTCESALPLRVALASYVDVASMPFTASMIDGCRSRCTTAADLALADLCTLLLHAMQPGEQGGRVEGVAFLVNMAEVFERYVARGLQQAVPNVQYQREFCYHEAIPSGQPLLLGRPDLTVCSASAVRCVLDVKWKALDATPPASDIQQVLAYAVGLACCDVRLVYPGRRNTLWEYALPNHVRLSVHTLRVVGPAEQCRRSLKRLVRMLR